MGKGTEAKSWQALLHVTTAVTLGWRKTAVNSSVGSRAQTRTSAAQTESADDAL